MRRLLLPALLLAAPAVLAQEDIYVEGYWLRRPGNWDGLASAHFVEGYWEEGSNGLGYDNFSWRLGDPFWTTPPNVELREEDDWFVENWAEGYSEREFQNPYYEAPLLDFTSDAARHDGRIRTDPRYLFEGWFHRAITFPMEEGDWCTVEVNSDDFDPHLIVIDPYGQWAESEDFGDWNPRADVTARRDGRALALISASEPEARGSYRVRIRRREGPINPDVVQRELSRRIRDEERRYERSMRPEPVEGPPPSPEATAPPVTRESATRWTDEDGGTYQFEPSTTFQPRRRW